MFRMRNRLTMPLALAMAIVAAPLLSGCFANPLEGLIEGATERVVEGAIEGVTGGENVSLGGELPDGFPSEVPLPAGTVLVGIGAEGSFTVSMEVDDPNFTKDDVTAQLEAAGFTLDADLGELGALFSNDSWSIAVSIITGNSDGKVLANYAVTPKNGG